MSGIAAEAFDAMDDVLGTWRFLLLISLPEGIGAGSGMKELALRCQQAVVPGVTIEQMTVGLHGHERSFRGRTIFSKTMACTFIETSNGIVVPLMRAWKELTVGTGSGNGGYSSEYAAAATLEVLDPRGSTTLEHRIFNLWPTDIAEVQLDGSSSTPYLQPVTFSFDRFVLANLEVDTAGEEATY